MLSGSHHQNVKISRVHFNYFASSETARRYEQFRPAVHGVIHTWLAAAGAAGPYRSAIDIACGTGHSTVPLLSLAQRVEGVDSSAEMIAIATAKGLTARVANYDNLPADAYDLLTVCMAFHWFDRAQAVKAFCKASAPEATWLIYNFWLAGHSTDKAFNAWYQGWYQDHFPSPQRSTPHFIPAPEDSALVLVTHDQGTLKVPFDRPSLIGYLTTQSNVDVRIREGLSFGEAQALIDSTMPVVSDTNSYVYGYSYSICKATRT
jgi:SAM-dependent methyltransferase